jgi:hypothetical protein
MGVQMDEFLITWMKLMPKLNHMMLMIFFTNSITSIEWMKVNFMNGNDNIIKITSWMIEGTT